MMDKPVLFAAALATLFFSSCDKTPQPVSVEYGIDGKTPLPEAVDMGITVNGSKVLWASFNLGASKEYEYGDFIAWGEFQAKDTYSWKNYKFSDGSGDDRIVKYCSLRDPFKDWALDSAPDGIMTLLPEDDAARKRLGGGWRMPTAEEFEALLSTSSDPNYSGWGKVVNAPGKLKDESGMMMRGFRITYKLNGNSIFLPLADCAGDDGVHHGTATWDGYHIGLYWTSSLDVIGGTGALVAYLHDHKNPYVRDNLHGIGNSSRYYGQSIRPVLIKD